MIQKLIKKYTEILNTLEKNNSIKDTTDYYPYSIDIENTNEFLNDLKDLANYTHSYLQLKDKETKVFEDWALKQGYYVEKYKWFDIAGDGINYYTIVNRYKRKFKL